MSGVVRGWVHAWVCEIFEWFFEFWIFRILYLCNFKVYKFLVLYFIFIVLFVFIFSCNSSSWSPSVPLCVRVSMCPCVPKLCFCHLQLLATYGNFWQLLDGPVLYIWSLGQFAYSKIDVSVCTLSQLPSPTNALFSFLNDLEIYRLTSIG